MGFHGNGHGFIRRITLLVRVASEGVPLLGSQINRPSLMFSILQVMNQPRRRIAVASRYVCNQRQR